MSMATAITQENSSVWSGAALNRLNQQTNAWLTEVLNTPGAKNAFLCDNRGNVLGALVNDGYDRAMLRRAGQYIAQIYGALEFSNSVKPKEMEMFFERVKITARDMGDAFGVVILTLNSNSSMVRMTMNVSSAAIESDAELQRALRTVGNSRRESLTQSSMEDGSWELAKKARLVG
jgi:hypothetical protein